MEVHEISSCTTCNKLWCHTTIHGRKMIVQFFGKDFTVISLLVVQLLPQHICWPLLSIIIKKINTDSLIPMLFDWSIDKLTRRDWQQKLMMSQHTAGSFVLCIRVLACKMAATDSYVLFFVYSMQTCVKTTNSAACMITQQRSLYYPCFEKITTERLHLKSWKRTAWIVLKCFVPFSRHVEVLKLTLHINHSKYLSPCGTKAYFKLQHKLYNAKKKWNCSNL